MKRLRVIILILLIIGIVIQFIRPSLSNPPVTGDLKAPPEVKAILERACYDCHSNQTQLKWFDQPAPAYWLVAQDVKDGRKVLNFSDWDSLSKGQQASKLFECVFQIEQKAMPLSAYTFLHHGGIITSEEIGVLKQYVGTLAYHPVLDTARGRAAEQQYEHWTKVVGPAVVKDEYNGIAYGELAGFAGWQVVSTTERYDNGTMRVIFGNPILIKAIREGHTNPYPDGAIFAKAAFDQMPDSSGDILTGAFKQVEFMIRDSKKYASTFGWGWARWVGGLALNPYGKDASFVTECLNCHRPLDKTDHTFTFPLADSLRVGEVMVSQPDSLAFVLRGKVVTSFVDTKYRTMSTLYSTKPVNVLGGYAPGTLLSLVTWNQRDDPHWFGGRIPQTVQSVEQIQIGADGKPEYNVYAGPNLPKKEMAAEQVAHRVQYITAKRAAVIP
jgi:hypothetical protein